MNKINGSFRDKNGININIDDDVLVPSPNETDIHLHQFVGFVNDILENGNVVVMDGDGDCFEIESDRLLVCYLVEDDEIDIEKELFPESDELVNTDGELSATIVDAELDPFECTFMYDGCVDIKTEGISYMKLSINNLYSLIRLIEESEEIYSNQSVKE